MRGEVSGAISTAKPTSPMPNRPQMTAPSRLGTALNKGQARRTLRVTALLDRIEAGYAHEVAVGVGEQTTREVACVLNEHIIDDAKGHTGADEHVRDEPAEEGSIAKLEDCGDQTNAIGCKIIEYAPTVAIASCSVAFSSLRW